MLLLWILPLILFLTSCTPASETSNTTFFGYTREYVASLDPIHAQDYFSNQMAAQVYEGLYHFKYKSKPLELEPLLAESLPQISKDGRILTIPLKKNILFHPHPSFKNPAARFFVAEDFIYSLKRLADARNNSPSFWLIENKIVGLDEWRKNLSTGTADYSTPILGLRAPSPHVVEIHLSASDYQFLLSLTMSATYVVAREVVESEGPNFGNIAVGTGAFRLDSWIRGSQLRFSKNLNYHSIKDGAQQLPYLDKLVIYEIPESQPQRLLFWKGDLDFLQPTKSQQDLVVKNGELLPQFQKLGYQLHLAPSPDITFLVFNNENPYLKNKFLRQALSMVFDKTFVVEKLYNFNAVAAHGPIPPSLEGYSTENKKVSPSFNVAAAKELLKKAGHPDGKGLPEFHYEMASSNTAARELAEYVKNQFSLLNIKIKLSPNTWPQFNEKIKKKSADLFDYAWNADYPDAQNFLQLFYGKNISPGPNSANYKNPLYDSLYEKALTLPPGAERTKLYIQMEKILIEDCPWVFQVHRTRLVVVQPWLQNFYFDVTVFDTMKYFSINTSLRKKFKEQGLLLGTR